MLSAANRAKLGNDNPTNQDIGLATALTYANTIVRVVVDSTAAAGFNFTMPVALRIADVVVQAQAAATTGTLQLRRLTTAITDAMTCAVDHTLARAATIDNAEAATTAGETLNFISTGSDGAEAAKVRAIVYIYGSPV